MEGLRKNIPSRYLDYISHAFDPMTKQSEFSDIVRLADEQDESYKRWLMLWTTSHNQSCPKDILYGLWREYLGRMAYRNMLRNLLRNPNFPMPTLLPFVFQLFWFFGQVASYFLSKAYRRPQTTGFDLNRLLCRRHFSLPVFLRSGFRLCLTLFVPEYPLAAS